MIGGGYVGLVSGACFAAFGTEVAVVEADPLRLQALREGRIPIYEPGLTELVAEGVAKAEDIDTSLRMAFNHPMGPLELGDLTGWDTRLAVLQYLHQTLGEKFRPCPLIIKLVKSGRHGRKTGRGIYDYDDNGLKIPNSGIRPF